MKGIDERKIPLSIFFDLSKAFDTLDHKILLSKLQHYGIHNTSLKWFHGYLMDRKQYVEYNNATTKCFPIYTGVPQGFILGRLLFIMYIWIISVKSAPNSFLFYMLIINTTMVSSMCMFTDTSSQEGSTMSNKINDLIVKVYDWLSHKKISLNISKTKFMLFHNYQKVLPDTAVPKLKIHDSEIERLTEFNFLGLTINEYLDMTSHSNKTAHKISRTLGVMNILKHELPYNALKMIYNSLILSHMQFNITAWGYAFNRIFKLQKRALCIMTCSKYNAHTDPIFKKAKVVKDTRHVSCSESQDLLQV